MSSLASVTAPPPLCRARERCSGARPGPAPRRAGPYRAVRADASASSTPRLPETIAEALDTVEAHFSSRGADLYAATPEVTAAVRTMVASKRTDGKTLSEVLDASDGVWEVFDMPHMRKLSSPARVGFKPVATILQSAPSVNRDGQPVQLEGRGRHDPCVLPRAVPMVEAMMCLVLADHALRQRAARLTFGA